MENDFEIIWTDLALEELAETVEYLERKFTEKEVDNLGDEIERILAIISANPHIFIIGLASGCIVQSHTKFEFFEFPSDFLSLSLNLFHLMLSVFRVLNFDCTV